NADEGRPRASGGIFRAGYLNRRAGYYVAPVDVRVEAPDEIRVRMRLLCDQFQNALVVHSLLPGFAEPGGADGAQPRQILPRDRVVRQCGRTQVEPRLGFRVQLARDRQPFTSLKGAQG